MPESSYIMGIANKYSLDDFANSKPCVKHEIHVNNQCALGIFVFVFIYQYSTLGNLSDLCESLKLVISISISISGLCMMSYLHLSKNLSFVNIIPFLPCLLLVS